MDPSALSDWLRAAEGGRWEAMQSHRLLRELAPAGPEATPAVLDRYLALCRGLAEDMLAVLGQALVKAPGTPQRRRVVAALHGVAEQRLALLERLSPAALRPETGLGAALLEIARLGSYADILAVLLALDGTASSWSARLVADEAALAPPVAEWVALHAGERFDAHVAWLRLETEREGAALDERGRARLAALFARALELAAAFHDAAYAEA